MKKHELSKQRQTMHCTPDVFTIGGLYVERNAIEENPSYQRESAVWSPDKQRLFIDSLINGYDIPKIYLHDLRPDKKLNKYSIIDGKQRLTTIYDFLKSVFHLDEYFELSTDSKLTDVKKLQKFNEFTPEDQERFKSISLPIVLVQNATEDDIEDLFSRLNNGEPLNAAEKRNGKGGNMNLLIKETADHSFFTEKLKFKSKRFSHFEISAKFILLEKTELDTNDIFSDLKKKYLDGLVDNNKKMTTALKDGLTKMVTKNLLLLNKVFSNKDPLLSKQAYPPLYYIFIKLMTSQYGHEYIFSYIRTFLEQFEVKRHKNNELPEDDRDVNLTEFGRLMQQGTNDISSLKNRVSILRRYFLLDYPDVRLIDKKRQFTDEERHVIYIMAGKQCSLCGKKFSDIDEMEADHPHQHAFGGETTLKNARALCSPCNEREKTTKK
jgi:hypothetical protein